MGEIKPTGEIKIGDNLYRFTGVSILSYEVFGIVEREKGRMYEIRCLDCRDHDQCQLLVVETQSDGLRHVSMISEEEQEYWHKIDGPEQRYETTKNRAVANRTRHAIKSFQDAIEKKEESIERDKKQISKLKATLEALDEDK